MVTKELLEAKFSTCGAIESVHLVNNVERSSGPSSVSGTESPRESLSGASTNTASTATAGDPQLVEDSELPSPHAPQPLPSQSLTSENLRELDDDSSRNNAFAFIRFPDAASAVSAIELFNDSVFLDRRLRVQYCETQEMKLKKKGEKYRASASQLYENSLRFGAGGVSSAVMPNYLTYPMRLPQSDAAIYAPLPPFPWIDRPDIAGAQPSFAAPLLPQYPSRIPQYPPIGAGPPIIPPYMVRTDHGDWVFLPQVRSRESSIIDRLSP